MAASGHSNASGAAGASGGAGAADPAGGEPPAAALARRSLREMVASQGLGVCADPWRCEALLRDMCGGSRREIFWLVSALRENVVADIVANNRANNRANNQAGLRQVPEPVLLARLTHKLSEELGLAPEPAQWTAGAWLEAVREAPASAPAPDLATLRPPLPAWPAVDEGEAGEFTSLPVGVDGRWLGLCLAGILVSGLALAVTARVAFYSGAPNPRGWLIDTGVLGVGLGLCALAEYGLARAFAAWGPRRRPEAARAPWALAPELLLLMVQPGVLVVGPLLWAGGWVGAWRYYGPSPDFAFHLGRLVQTIVVAAFLVYWADWMTRIQGQVATTMVRHR